MSNYLFTGIEMGDVWGRGGVVHNPTSSSRGIRLLVAEKVNFCVIFLQLWCGKAREQYLKSQVETDSHSPGMFR